MRSQNGILLSYGNRFNVKDIINRPEDFVRPDESGHTLLHTACEIGDIKAIEEIIRLNSANLRNVIDMKGLSHFHVVAISSFTDVLKRLLKENVVPDINAAISDASKFFPGFTALHIACLQRNVEHVGALLRHGAHSKSKNAFGHTAYELLLLESARLNRLIVDPDLKHFFAKSKYKKYIDKFNIDSTSMSYRIELRKIYKIIELIVKAAEGNYEFDDKGFSTLHFLVCEAQSPETLVFTMDRYRHLVNSKVNEDVPFYGSCTPLHLAAYFHYDDIVSFLLKNGANPLIKTNQNENALVLRLKDFFDAYKNDQEYQKKCGKRPILIPTFMNPALLLDNQDYIDKFGMKTVHLAVGADLTFFQKFCSIEQPNLNELVAQTESKYNYYEGNTPLHLALIFKKWGIANYLLDMGVIVTIPNKSGNTPLHLCHDAATFKKLLKLGANIDVKNRANLTPLKTTKCNVQRY